MAQSLEEKRRACSDESGGETFILFYFFFFFSVSLLLSLPLHEVGYDIDGFSIGFQWVFNGFSIGFQLVFNGFSMGFLSPSMRCEMISMGTGKTIVLLFSAEMLLNVCRYRSWEIYY